MLKESMDRAIRIVEEKKLTCEDRGALLVDLTKFKMDRAIIRKAGGSTMVELGLTGRWYIHLPDSRSGRGAR